MPPESNPTSEAQRLLTICNACRYCEGYCAVFPAMERRISFNAAGVQYLANLCHNCAECYYACQYAPPHEFAVNIPRVFAQLRAESYARSAAPARLWGSRWLPWSIAPVVIGIASQAGGDGASFYSVIPQAWMTGVFLVAGVLAVVLLLAGGVRFWRGSGPPLALDGAVLPALRDAFTLKNLSSNGPGCTYPDEYHSNSRRWFHHLTFYGFLLCFASTSVAAGYHYLLGWEAPYPYLSVPVILGTAGGLGLLIGPAGLWTLKRRRDPAIGDSRQDASDEAFLAALFLTSLTGLALMLVRETAAMRPLLLLHLAIVLGLFLTLPYGKFVHGIYRTLALVRDAAERRLLSNCPQNGAPGRVP